MIEKDKRVEQVRELWRRWSNARKEWEDHAREDIDLYLGNHFSADEADELARKSGGLDDEKIPQSYFDTPTTAAVPAPATVS